MAQKSIATIVPRNPKDLISAEYNPRSLSEEQHRTISDSIKRFGFVDPVIVNKHKDRMDIIIGGHQRVKVAESLGYTEVPTVELKLTLEQEKELNVRLNKNTGSFDYDMLANHFEVESLIEWGFSSEELDFFEPEEEPEVEEDDYDEEPPEDPKTELGRIYQLGDHRLMCGDSTSEVDVKMLMDGDLADMVFTDPPYGVSYTNNMNDNHDVIMNDDVILDFRILLKIYSKNNTHWYIWTSDPVYDQWREMYKDEFKSTVVWYKGGGCIGDLSGDYARNYELCLFCQNGRRELNGSRDGGVWEIGKDAGSDYDHPTQKPVKLSGYALTKSSNSGDIVLDLFGGSGSTLIACDQSNRQCRMMELDPKYCDVIVKRYCKLKGIDSDKVFETGVA
jgi:DNA modification methylase